MYIHQILWFDFMNHNTDRIQSDIRVEHANWKHSKDENKIVRDKFFF